MHQQDSLFLKKKNGDFNGRISLKGKNNSPTSAVTLKEKSSKKTKKLVPETDHAFPEAKGSQGHGGAYQQWIGDTFFKGYVSGATEHWDIPVEHNTKATSALPARLHNLPVSIKVSKVGSSVNLGDAMRQRSIKTDFLIIVALWKQDSSSTKMIEQVGISVIPPAIWDSLWGGITMKDLQELEAIIKDTNVGYKETRKAAQKWKVEHQDILDAAGITLNPKIDSKNQRRLQCSLNYKKFIELAWFETQPPQEPLMCGVTVPNPILSGARKFKKDSEFSEETAISLFEDALVEDGKSADPLYSQQSLFTPAFQKILDENVKE